MYMGALVKKCFLNTLLIALGLDQADEKFFSVPAI